jgi:hypothetical protein
LLASGIFTGRQRVRLVVLTRPIDYYYDWMKGKPYRTRIFGKGTTRDEALRRLQEQYDFYKGKPKGRITEEPNTTGLRVAVKICDMANPAIKLWAINGKIGVYQFTRNASPYEEQPDLVKAAYFSYEVWMIGYFRKVPDVRQMIEERIVSTIERMHLPKMEKLRLRAMERYGEKSK